MKKVLAIIALPYLVFLGVMFYIYFGPGIITTYEPLRWRNIEINVPKNFKSNPYESKGWVVYSLKKLSVLIKIAQKPALDVTTLPRQIPRLLYQFSPVPDSIFYISNPRKAYEVVYARTVDDITLYFSVSSPSVYSATYVLDKMLTHASYLGTTIPPPRPDIPISAYLTDFFFLGGMLIPLIIIIFVLGLSGARPGSNYFIGDPITCEESYVSFTRVQRFRRKNTFCCVVKTVSRLMVFVFKKPVLEIRLQEESPDIRLKGKKFIIQRLSPAEKIVLRPSDTEKWKDALSGLIRQDV